MKKKLFISLQHAEECVAKMHKIILILREAYAVLKETHVVNDSNSYVGGAYTPLHLDVYNLIREFCVSLNHIGAYGFMVMAGVKLQQRVRFACSEHDDIIWWKPLAGDNTKCSVADTYEPSEEVPFHFWPKPGQPYTSKDCLFVVKNMEQIESILLYAERELKEWRES